jgi:signal transduction histidine kinase
VAALTNPSIPVEYQGISRQDERSRDINRQTVMLLGHELGTPLTHVLAYLRLLQERTPISDRIEIDLAVEQALLLKSHLDDILLLNQLESNACELRCAPIVMQEVIARVVESQRWRIQEKGISLRTLITSRKTIHGDKEMLCRAVTHLVVNACKFSNTRGPIDLRVRDLETVCSVEVSDHGIGIPPEKQQEIFEPFYQVDQTRARRYNGMGIGLVLARAIAEKHGGTIQVVSRVGEGSTFTLTIPLAQ